MRTPHADDARTRVVTAAARLLRDHGPDAVTTRGVADAAGLQAPAIYRLFGDKDGLLDAVAEHVMQTFVTDKAEIVAAATADAVDPLDDLHDGWHAQVAFGLANPTLFRLLSDPARVVRSPAAALGRQVLEQRVRRVAATGRLAVDEGRAVAMIQAAGIGTIEVLLATPVAQRDPGLAEAVYDAVLRQLLSDAPGPTVDPRLAAVVALGAVRDDLDMLSESERRLLGEWLDRAVRSLRH